MKITFLITKSNSIIGLDETTWKSYELRKVPGYRIATANEVESYGTEEQIKAYEDQSKAPAIKEVAEAKAPEVKTPAVQAEPESKEPLDLKTKKELLEILLNLDPQSTFDDRTVKAEIIEAINVFSPSDSNVNPE